MALRGFPSMPWRGPALALLAGVLACSELLVDPASDVTVALAVSLERADADVFDLADGLAIRVTPVDGSGVLADTTLPVSANGGDIRTTLALDVAGEEGLPIQIVVRLARGNDELFSGTAVTVLARAASNPIEVPLVPTATRVQPPPPRPPIETYGDTITIGGTLFFATGDTIRGLSPQWASRDPSVALVVGGSRLVALRDGTVVLDGHHLGLATTATLTVRAQVVSVGFEPDPPTLGRFQTIVLRALPRDSRGNVIEGRDATWAVGDTRIADLDPLGGDSAALSGFVLGSTTVQATVDQVVGVAPITVTVAAPSIVGNALAGAVSQTGADLSVAVNPLGSATSAWFEWGTDALLAGSAQTPTASLGSGIVPVSARASLSGLTAGTVYYFRAVATNQGGTTLGPTESFSTLQAPPAPPTGLSGSYDASSARVLLAWTDNSSDETRFEVERALSRQGLAFVPLASVAVDVTTYADASAANNESYVYRVRACNAGGCSAYSGQLPIVIGQQPPTVLTLTPTARTVSAVAHGSINPNGVATVARYDWGLSPTLATFSVTPSVPVGAGSVPVVDSAFIGGLAEGTTYYVRASGTSSLGTRTGSIVPFTTTPFAPSSLAAVYDTAQNGVTLFWTDNSGAETTFRLERQSLVPVAPYVLIAVLGASQTTYLDTSVITKTTVQYRVQACRNSVCSIFAFSFQVSVP